VRRSAASRHLRSGFANDRDRLPSALPTELNGWIVRHAEAAALSGIGTASAWSADGSVLMPPMRLCLKSRKGFRCKANDEAMAGVQAVLEAVAEGHIRPTLWAAGRLFWRGHRADVTGRQESRRFATLLSSNPIIPMNENRRLVFSLGEGGR
jgi:hypothetical protein